MRENQAGVAERQRRYYARIKGLKTKSQTEKDRVYAAMVSARNQLLSLDEKIATLKRQIEETRAQWVQTDDSIAKKRIVLKGRYIYKVAVRPGDFVNPGTPLVTAMDIKKGRLVVYLDRDEVTAIGRLQLYVDGKPRDWPIEKVLKVADETHISSYRVEIVVPEPSGLFSKLMKIEWKARKR
jgi:hypothetical protein